MSRTWGRARLLAVVAAAIGMLACGREKKAVPLRIEISPPAVSVAVGISQPLAVTAIYSDSVKETVTGWAKWSSSDASIVAISGAGARGLKAGTATVTATYGGASASATLTVTPAEVARLGLTVGTPTVPKGLTGRFAATAVMTDDTVADVTQAGTWSSSAPAVLAVREGGAFEALAAGEALVTASFAGKTASAKVAVAAAQLVSLEIQPAAASVPIGLTTQLRAVGTFSDDSTADLTSTVTWCSSKEQYARVSNDTGTEGLVTAVGEGVTSVCAIEKCTGLTAHAQVTVTAAVAVSVTVAPAVASLPKGDAMAFTASAVFSDRSSRDVTADAIWTSSDASVATIENAVGRSGRTLGVGVGTATIAARIQGVDGPTGTAELQVTDAVLRSIAITPSNGSTPKGVAVQLTATGTYSDASVRDLTAAVTWSSSEEDMVTVSNAVETKGLASALATGEATVGVVEPASGVEATTRLTVTAAVPKRIELDPTSATIPKGRTQAFKAWVVFSDGGRLDFTANERIAWSSSAPGVASVAAGVATGLAVGAADVVAAYRDTEVSASAPLTVTAATITDVAVGPGDLTLPKGATRQLSATGIFTDTSSRDVTDDLSWSASNGAVAAVSNGNSPGHGFLTALAVGTSEISATDPTTGATNHIHLTVTPEELVRIVVTPPAPIRPLGVHQQFTATGVYTDESTQDLTDSVTWSSSAPAVVSISNAPHEHGDAQSEGVGTATITATYPGTLISSTATMTVTDAVVQAIEVVPSVHSMALGRSVVFDVFATYTDGYRTEVSTQAVCGGGGDAVEFGTVGGHPSATGVAEVVDAEISCGLPFTVIEGTATLTITQKVLDSIVIRTVGGATSIAKGLTQPFAAEGYYSNQSHEDFTGAVTWSSSTTALIFRSMDPKGVGYAGSVGTPTITATDPITGIVSNALPFEVTDARLLSIVVTADGGATSVPIGRTLQLTATGIYTDGTTPTLEPDWTVGPDGDATIDPDGLLTGVAKGDVVVTAAFAGVTGTLPLTVTDAVLDHLVLSADPGTTVPKGVTIHLTAMGHMSDQTEIPYTNTVLWTIDAPQVATVASGGVVTTLSAGTAIVTAEDGSTHIRQPIGITVTPALLRSIRVEPGAVRVPAGLSQRYEAWGTYSDGTEINLSDTVDWISSDLDWVVIYGPRNPWVNAGQADTFNDYPEGWDGDVDVTITAQYPGSATLGTAILTVTAPIVTRVRVDPSWSCVTVGGTKTLSARAVYSDGVLEPVSAEWSSSAPGVASVGLTSGVVTGVSAGTAEITAQIETTNEACPGGCTVEGAATVIVVCAH